MTEDASSAGDLPDALRTRFRLGRLLGSGGHSEVYAAYDSVLRREVAIKVFHSGAVSAEDLRLQQAEARLLASLNHPALTTLFDVGIDASRPDRPRAHLVMELVRGHDLRVRLRQGALAAAQVCSLGVDLAEGLDHVHGAGFLHRDIKPANVLLLEHSVDGATHGKLTDFGIATSIGEPGVEGNADGTAAYLSPEQVVGEQATPLSDVYALGLVLLEAVTGRLAYPGDVQRTALARLDRQPEIPEDLPRDLADVLRAMTARRPEDRPALRDVAERLRRGTVPSAIPTRAPHRSAPHRSAPQRAASAALLDYAVLDTPPEDAFDVVTRLACRLLRVPGAVVSIVDRDRVWFKSRRGVEQTEVERNVAFCLPDDAGVHSVWTIPDVLRDERLRQDPVVVGAPFLRSYAAAALVTRDGHRLGALCVYDTVPREFDAQELQSLIDLAAIVMRELELRLSSRRAVFAGR